MPLRSSLVPARTDLLVIGGGPAGLSAAIAARRSGLDVVVADAAVPPIDKACGEGLMPDSIAALQRLGVQPWDVEAFPFDGIRFLGEGVEADAKFPRGQGLGIRRTRLHPFLVERATGLGASLIWGARVTPAAGGVANINGQAVRYKWLAGADGENSRVRRWAGLDAAHRTVRRFGFRRHYRMRPWTTRMEIHWAAGCQMYVTPIAEDEVCIVLLGRDPHLRFDGALPRFPALQDRLRGKELAGPERGAVTTSRRLRRVAAGNTFLVGDASGSVDAITGEGLSLCFRQADALAEALASGNPSQYQEEHRRQARRPAMMASLMLTLDRSPWLRSRVLRTLSRNPEIFSNLLAVHVGALPMTDILFRGMLPLGWRLLTP